MNRLRDWLEASFHTKVLVPVVSCMVVVMAVTAFVVNKRITSHFEAEAQGSLKSAQEVFNDWQLIHADELRRRFRNVANSLQNRIPFKKAYDSPKDATAIKALTDRLNELSTEQGVDLLLFTSSRGESFPAVIRDPSISDSALHTAVAPEVSRVLQSDDAVAEVVCVGDKLYDVVSVRAFNTDNKLQLGVLTLGTEIGQAVAGQLNDLTQCKVVLMAGSNVIAYADFSSDSKEKLAEWFRQSPYEPFQADYSSPAKKEVLQGVHYFYRCGRLMSSRNDRTMGYLLLYSNDQQTSELERTQALLLTVNLAAILLGSAVVWFFVRRATGPLHELRVNAEAVGHGDFSRRVAVRSRDECGQLGRVFNQMTENLQESRAELEKTVETLKGTQAQLIQSEKLSGVGEFVAGVAHELNNPLAAVMGFSELLKDSNTDERQGRHLDIIYKSSQRCQKIVQSLLSFARRHQPERKPVQVNKLIEAVLEIINYQLRTGNIKVTLQLDPNLPMVEGDEHQLQQVLLNIINNARQAIDLNKPGGWIKIVTEVSEPNIRILIHDSGPGIPEENLTRIFDPFFTTKDVGKGTGLGLSLCYGIIKEHGGTITPLNRNGEGATFIIELPILRVEGGADETSGSTEHETTLVREGTGKKVLVIDDEESVLLMVGEVLGRHDYQVHTAADGETALRDLKDNHYDVVLCDWKMPGLTGRQVYERLRATNPEMCRRVIFITGDVINEPMQKFLEQEDRPCLTKPFALAELRKTIKTVLSA